MVGRPSWAALWDELSAHVVPAREVRADQPLMVLTTAPPGA